jgi:hypothetical protein
VTSKTAIDKSKHTPTAAEQVEFQLRLTRATEEEAKVPVRFVDDARVVWSPQAGSQTSFLQCPIFECLYHGTRGPGKTDGLIMSFAQHVGKGYGHAWRGVIFRETYPQLADVQAKTEKWFRQMFPGAKFNRGKMMWTFAGGEVLLLRHFAKEADYWNYHGHEYPFIGWEEMTNWPSDDCFRSMFSCCRSSTPGVPNMVRGTTNPYGVGHSWVQMRYRLTDDWWNTIVQPAPVGLTGEVEKPRCAIHGHIDENKILLHATPDYKTTIISSARNKEMAKAWLKGDWNIVAGGMFSDVWVPEFNILPKFEIPKSWRIDRSFDWGSSKPFAVGWWARSDGSDLLLPGGQMISTVRGDLFRVAEWYGFTGKPNQGLHMLATEVSEGIVEREILWGWRPDPKQCRVNAGPADSSIFTVESGHCIASDMQKPVRIGAVVYKGIAWTRADKRPGSRKQGWELLRKMMKSAHRNTGLPREKPGLFVVGSECSNFLRTVLSLPRDEKDLDDIDTNAEDHIADEVRYRIRSEGLQTRSGTTTGMY